LARGGSVAGTIEDAHEPEDAHEQEDEDEDGH
jgi:hypothetical protein